MSPIHHTAADDNSGSPSEMFAMKAAGMLASAEASAVLTNTMSTSRTRLKRSGSSTDRRSTASAVSISHRLTTRYADAVGAAYPCRRFDTVSMPT